MSDKYYGKLLLRYLRQRYLMDKWQALGKNDRTTENCAIFVAEWFQPEELLLEPKIKSLFDDLAERAKELLRTAYPGHSLFNVPDETLQQWRTKRLLDNQFDADEAKRVFDCLLRFFKGLGFTSQPLRLGEKETLPLLSIDKVYTEFLQRSI